MTGHLNADVESIELRLPATSQYLHVARLVAAGVAGRLGFGYDEIDDLRIAVDEMCFLLLRAEARAGEIEVAFRADGDSLVIEGLGLFGASNGATDATIAPEDAVSLSHNIAAALVDDLEVTLSDEQPKIRLVKRRRSAES